MVKELPLTSSAAAAAAKSLQSCPTLCDPIDGSPPGSPIPEILQAIHSSTIAWKIPWTEDRGLKDRATSLAYSGLSSWLSW